MSSARAAGRDILADLAPGGGRALGPADERLHTPPDGARAWTETSWWGFTAENGRAGGWVYLQVRPALETVGLGVWVWDTASVLPWELPYARQMHYLPLGDGDLDGLDLPGAGLRLRCLEPFARHRLSYAAVDGLELDLDLAARGAPHGLGIGPATGHIDQLLWATGEARLGDRRLAVDGAACRDRTWSERAETSTAGRNAYVWGLGEDGGFHGLLVLGADGVTPRIAAGHRTAEGEDRPITGIVRRVVDRGDDGRPRRMELDLTSAGGRRATATGEATSGAAIMAFAGYLTWTSVVRWKLDGDVLWGEDHESWPLDALRDARRGEPPTDLWEIPSA